MRLLHAKDLYFDEFLDDYTPDYVIISHMWNEAKQELSYRDFVDGKKRDTKGYAKVISACEKAIAHGYDWIWVDTFCIDKTSSSELSEAINSMFRWYQNAQECFVYLADVTWLERHDGFPSTTSSNPLFPQPAEGRRVGSLESRHSFRNSRWHTRSWMLQELLAPSKLIFYDKDWVFIGMKEDLLVDISAATGIAIKYLTGNDFHEANAATKMSWAASRRCVRPEDISYSLLGIFNVNMPILYGEGSNAFIRLQEEIWRRTGDKSLFAWTIRDEQTGKWLKQSSPPPGARWREIQAAFAPSPSAFKHYVEQIKAGEDNDDVASKMSMDSMGSTTSGSAATLIEALVAAEEFVDILRKDERLTEIFSVAMEHVALEELKSKIRELLKIYSIDLQQEVSNSLEKDAVQLVRRRRAFIALRVCQQHDTSAGMRERQFAQIIQQDPDKHALLEEYARTRSAADVESEPVGELESGDEDEVPGSPSSSEGEPDKLEPTDLDRVKAFMVQSAAYERLIQNFRDFILSYGESGRTIGKNPVPRGVLPADLWHRLHMKVVEVIQSVKMLCRPVVPSGYERITWICGCGEQRFADIRQYAPQGAARLQAALRNSAITVATDAAGDDPSGNPSRPPQAHLSDGSSTDPSFQNMSQFIYARSTDPNSTGRVSLNSVYTSMPEPDDREDDHIFLLLCVTVNGVSTLEQLDVRGIQNDKYLFNKIRETYHQLDTESAWHQKVALTSRLASGSGWISWLLKAIKLTAPRSISFVRFQLVPVGMDVRPWNFHSPELPPEVELMEKKTYHYTPHPIEGNLNDLGPEIVHPLLQPNKAHLNHFWLDLFPKKLKEELLYNSGSTDMCTGWGIHIVEGIDWFVLIVLIFVLVSFSGIFGIVYSVLARDVSGGFAIAAFLTTLPALGLGALQLMPAS